MRLNLLFFFQSNVGIKLVNGNSLQYYLYTSPQCSSTIYNILKYVICVQRLILTPLGSETTVERFRYVEEARRFLDIPKKDLDSQIGIMTGNVTLKKLWDCFHRKI